MRKLTLACYDKWPVSHAVQNGHQKMMIHPVDTDVVLAMAAAQGPKAGTHWPSRWTSEAFGETWGIDCTLCLEVGNKSVRCVQLRWKLSDVVCSNSTCEVWGGWLSAVWAIGFSDWLCASCMTILISGVLANQCGVWEGQNTEYCVCFVFLCTPFRHFQFSCSATRLLHLTQVHNVHATVELAARQSVCSI